ncbi:MAG TPA: hopanoid biosynthesis-associated protein HpnK [Candidatus Binataceae bacterium]|nr:hopanoid biosynthesis-associated protein HpnK [Candidatus Binataceae bacterium]
MSSSANRSAIISADDFGLSREVNAGILKAHREGILTGTSLMVAGAAAEEAAAIARDTPTLDVGLHLVVCHGSSTLDPTKLVGITNASGDFSYSPVTAGMRYYFNRKIHSALRDEMRAQIERHLQLVGYLNHIDGHLNFHVHPVVADILIELIREYRVPCVRLPRESVFSTLALAHDNAARKLVENVIFRALSRRTRKMLDAAGVRSTNWLFGLHQSGHLSEAYVAGLIPRLQPGITEIYFHPAMDIGGTPPSAEAQLEVAILTDPHLRTAFDEAGVQLINFANLASSPHTGAPLPFRKGVGG